MHLVLLFFSLLVYISLHYRIIIILCHYLCGIGDICLVERVLIELLEIFSNNRLHLNLLLLSLLGWYRLLREDKVLWRNRGRLYDLLVCNRLLLLLRLIYSILVNILWLILLLEGNGLLIGHHVLNLVLGEWIPVSIIMIIVFPLLFPSHVISVFLVVAIMGFVIMVGLFFFISTPLAEYVVEDMFA